jgi:hypothetical protein
MQVGSRLQVPVDSKLSRQYLLHCRLQCWNHLLLKGMWLWVILISCYWVPHQRQQIDLCLSMRKDLLLPQGPVSPENLLSHVPRYIQKVLAPSPSWGPKGKLWAVLPVSIFRESQEFPWQGLKGIAPDNGCLSCRPEPVLLIWCTSSRNGLTQDSWVYKYFRFLTRWQPCGTSKKTVRLFNRDYCKLAEALMYSFRFKICLNSPS